MGNPFVHIELESDDVAKSKKFYKKLFDWSLKDMPMGPGMVYTGIGVGKGTGGGMQQSQSPGVNRWLPYVEVADVKKTIAKAKKGGAVILVEYQEIPGMGALGVFTDPSGALLGIWEPAKKSAKKDSKKKKDAKKTEAKKSAPKKAAAAKKKAKKG
jgi:predicted enzyme related to lactoylglutathione lyase